MKCEKCNQAFPMTIKIENKRHNLCNRKYCLNCSPFKEHNTKNLNIQTNKWNCYKCKTPNLTEENFYTKNGTKTYSYCRNCSSNDVVIRLRKMKQKCVDYKGGKCCKCGYNKYTGALEFHHLDPKEKDFNISKSRLSKWSNKITSELDKCILVCSNCHKEIHGNIISPEGET